MKPRVYVVTLNPRDHSASFIRAHIDHLPAVTVPVHGYLPSTNGSPVLSQGIAARGWRKLDRLVNRRDWSDEITQGYLRIFDRSNTAVLAEYGPNGVRVMDACDRAGIPLIVHFHGYDASVTDLLEKSRADYQKLFSRAAAIVAVSMEMRSQLIRLGAPSEKVAYNPYGVDCAKFRAGDRNGAGSTVLAAGYFVEKKAPHLTILSFAHVLREHPQARLRMVGNGPLLAACQDLVGALRLQDAVTFLGEQPHEVVQREMSRARCFVQHSIRAQDGNSEGLPNVILEAGASALAVVSTRHAGIVDAVVEGETGFLVAEKDIGGMAARLNILLADRKLADTMGVTARAHVERNFAMPDRIAKLWAIIESAMAKRPIPSGV